MPPDQAPHHRGVELGRRVLAPRDGVTTALINRATTSLLLVGATTTGVGVVLRDDLPHRTATALFAVGAVVVAGVVHLLRHRLPVRAYHLTQVGSSLAIATGVHLYGGGEHALADASLMVLPVATSAFYFSGPGVAAHAALSVLSLVVALAPLVTSPADLFTPAVVITVTAVLVRALARASESTGADPLTRLPDRTATTSRLRRAVEQSQRTADPVTFAVLGLDRFSAVNDIRGHAAGDALLRSLARTWRAALPAGSLLGRWGGDQFALVLRCHADEAWQLLDALRASCPEDLGFSAGVVVVEVDDDVEGVIDHAEGSLAAAKHQHRGGSHLWVPGTPTSRSFLEALEAGGVEVHYQPVVSLGDGSTTGAEALVRWRRPDGSFVPPADFLPHAEASGAVVHLGRHVLHRACADAASWPVPAGGQPLTVAVNASGVELARPDYAAWAVAALHASGLPRHRLVVEVVEGLLDDEAPVVLDNLHALRAAGVRLAVDDFGTGFSNLSRLGHLPLDVLKVDRSFVSAVQPGADAPVCAGVVALAHALDLTLVAEGVETEHQAAWLRERGCQEGQGWLWAPALPNGAFAERLLRPPAPLTPAPAPRRAPRSRTAAPRPRTGTP